MTPRCSELHSALLELIEAWQTNPEALEEDGLWSRIEAAVGLNYKSIRRAKLQSLANEIERKTNGK